MVFTQWPSDPALTFQAKNLNTLIKTFWNINITNIQIRAIPVVLLICTGTQFRSLSTMISMLQSFCTIIRALLLCQDVTLIYWKQQFLPHRGDKACMPLQILAGKLYNRLVMGISHQSEALTSNRVRYFSSTLHDLSTLHIGLICRFYIKPYAHKTQKAKDLEDL